MLSSVYYLAQLFGGVLFGWLSDQHLTRKQVLVLSLLGSALAYLLLGLSKHTGLVVISRILVGIVKHTMTICTANTITPKTPTTNATAILKLRLQWQLQLQPRIQ